MGDTFASGFASTLADKLKQKADQQRANEQKLKDQQAQIYIDSIKSGRLSPEQLEYAQGQLQKLYGASKPIKELFGKFQQAMHLGGKIASGGAEGAQTPPLLPAGMPNAPTAAASTSAPATAPATSATKPAAVPAAMSSTAPASTPTSALPPAPSFGSITSAAYPSPDQLAVEKAHAAALGLRTSVQERKQLAPDIGLKEGTPEYEEWVATGKYPTTFMAPKIAARRVAGGDLLSTYPGITTAAGTPPDPKKLYDLAYGPGGVPFAQPSGETAQQAAPAKVNLVAGVPTSVTRAGKTVTPDSPDWTPDDQRVWDAAQTAYQKGVETKKELQATWMKAYALVRGMYTEYPVIDMQTGQPTYANPTTINANPGRFGPGSLTQQLKNRVGIFDEIGYTTKQVEDALEAMPEFDTKQRAQIAAVVSAPDPESALSLFKQSEMAATLTQEQANYVTSVVSLEESAMSLRSLGGMGAGSDQLRRAILNMVVGAPNKAYARRQLQLFKGEVRQLRGSLPASERLGMPSGGGAGEPTKPRSMPKAPPKIGDIVNGYRFLGGDPKLPSSWKKAA